MIALRYDYGMGAWGGRSAQFHTMDSSVDTRDELSITYLPSLTDDPNSYLYVLQPAFWHEGGVGCVSQHAPQVTWPNTI